MKQVLISTTLFLFLSTHFLLAQTRNCDPVVLEGNEASCMLGFSPNEIVGFSYQQGQWKQIPIQIDERIFTSVRDPYRAPNGPCEGNNETDYIWNVYFYADPNTFTGSDPNPNFDGDDELAFMYRDAGGRAVNSGCPANVIASSRCEVEIFEPLSANANVGYIYLFRQTGALAQDAGKDYVDYDYDDFGGNYKANYKVCFNGEQDINLENSWLHTANYSMHFRRRWENDQLILKKGNMPNTDILDSHQYFTSNVNCTKTEVTFSQRRGPIIANIDGPIRGIRSVMGAHSGTYMELTLVMSECRADNRFYYRIHPSAGYFEARDLNSNAIGMSFYSNRNPSPLIIDGNRDDSQFTTIEPSEWELTEGAQGSIISAYVYDTDIIMGTQDDFNQGLANGYAEAYYRDWGSDDTRRCSGDLASYGASGFHFRSRKCTDRLRNWSENPSCMPDQVNFFEAVRYNYMLPPQVTVDQAKKYANFSKNPLLVQTSTQSCAFSGGATCNDGLQNGDETGIDCGGSICPACSTNCSGGDIVLNTVETTGTHIYDNNNSITSSAEIESGSNISFLAESYVLLQDGFHAKAGSTFRAAIETCAAATNESIETRNLLIEQPTLDVYPNPAKEEVWLKFQLSTSSSVVIELYDLSGKQLRQIAQQTVYEAGKHQYLLDISNLTSGLYWISLKTKDGVLTKKLMIQ